MNYKQDRYRIWADHVEYIVTLCSALSRQFPIIEIQEVLSVVYEAIEKALDIWDEKRSFKPLLRKCILSGFYNEMRKEKRYKNRNECILDVNVGENQSPLIDMVPDQDIWSNPALMVEMQDELDNMTMDQKLLIQMALEEGAYIEDAKIVNPKNARGTIREELMQKHNWTGRKFWRVSDEIGRMQTWPEKPLWVNVLRKPILL